MINETFVACETCHSEGEMELPMAGSTGSQGPLCCVHCRSVITIVSVHPWRPWLEDQVRHKDQLHRSGQLRSRRQARGPEQSELRIDLDGLEAELAACLLLCPAFRDAWWVSRGPNRGMDLPRLWTGLPRPVEVKQTRYRDEHRGYLIVRPPRNTPGPMRTDHIDDSLYVLMHGQDGLYTLVGWADRQLLLERGRLNPVPVLWPGQRQCWGVHWSQLYPPQDLVGLMHDREHGGDRDGTQDGDGGRGRAA